MITTTQEQGCKGGDSRAAVVAPARAQRVEAQVLRGGDELLRADASDLADLDSGRRAGGSGSGGVSSPPQVLGAVSLSSF